MCNLDYPANRVSAVAEINQKVKKRRLIRLSTHSRTPAQLQCTYAPTHPTNHCNDFYLFALSPDFYCLSCRSQAQQRLSWWHIRNPGHLLTCCFPNQRKFLANTPLVSYTYTLSNTNHFTTYNHHSTKLKFTKPARKNTKNTDTEPPSVITVLFTPGYHGMT